MMKRDGSPHRGRLWTFLTVLGFQVVAFSGGAWWINADLLTIGPAYMFTPAVATAVVCWRYGIAFRSVGLRLGRPRWLAIAALLWIPVGIATAGLSLLVPGVTFDPSMIATFTGVPAEPGWLIVGFLGMTALMIVVGATMNAVLAFGEEFGWRGYLLVELAPLGFWPASALIGLCWGLWHAPLVLAGLNYPSFPIAGIAVFTVVCLAMSPIYTYLVVKAGSVLPAAVLHGVFNATGFVGLAVTDDPIRRELIASDGGLVGLVVLTGIILWIARTGPPTLTRAVFDDRSGEASTVDEPTVDPVS